MKNHYDVFISHASEDKDLFVKPLSTALAAMGVRVWYDEFSLSPGDSLSKSIDRGLAASSYGLVVLSPSFLIKPWPDYELRGLVAKEIGHDKVIIPLWFGVSRDDVLSFSPPLADKFAIVVAQLSLDEVTAEILRIVRPDLHDQYRRLLLSKDYQLGAHTFATDNVRGGPIRHTVLPKLLLSRINIVRHIFLEFLPDTFGKALDTFRRDTHPEQEVIMWEAMAAVYLDFLKERSPKAKQRKAAFGMLLHLSADKLPANPENKWPILQKSEIAFISERWQLFGVHLPIGVRPIEPRR